MIHHNNNILLCCRNAKHEMVTSCVIDAEVVAYDREKGCLLPFQILSTRKRKVEDGDEDQKVSSGGRWNVTGQLKRSFLLV